MVYQGSKAKLRKYILPIIQNCINENHIENYYEPFCLDSSTIVFTKNGIKTIEELQIGDYILNENGNFIEVINKVESNEHNGRYIKIKGNVDVIATDNHKFYVNSNELSVCELKLNMSLDTGLQSINENPIIDLSKYITVTKNYKKGRNGKIINENKIKLSHVSPITNRYVPITKELMHCYGLVIAEGDKSNLTMNENELNYLEEFIKNYLNILGIQDNCKKYYHRNHDIQLAIPYKTIYEKLFFNAMNVGYGARNKNISFLFSVTNDMVLEALRYMIIGDGCVRQKGNYCSICYKTTSKTLAYQLQCLLSIKFGIKSTISYGVSKSREIEGRKISSTDYYNISIHREDDIKFILMESNNNIQIHENTKKYKITNIEKIQNRTFYDITVNSKSHKFLIQGGIITHN